MDWHSRLSERARAGADPELAIILAGPPPGTLQMAGGFPNPATFPTDELAEIAARLVRDEPGLALQYTASEGIPSVRRYLIERVAHLQGREPAWEELTVTSGGMECIDLLSRSMLDPGDDVAVEGPTYLGAIMAFRGYRARLTGVPMDEHGLDVGWFEERLEGGYRPKFLYIIPEFQNPSGRTLTLERRQALVDVCRRYGVLIFEDVAYRELSFDGTSLPSLWSLGPDVVLQAGTFSKVLCPGVRLGWACGPAEIVAKLASAKNGTDQCSGAPRAADHGGVRPRGALRRAAAGRAGALRLALGGAVGGAGGAHARRVRVVAADRRDVHLAAAAGRAGLARSCAPRRPRPASRTCPGGRSTSTTRARARSGCPSAR